MMKNSKSVSLESMDPYYVDGWVKIGVLKDIYIYPLDTGYGFRVNNAICTKNGLQSYSLREDESGERILYADRTFMAFKKNKENLLDNSLLAEVDDITLFQTLQKRVYNLLNESLYTTIDCYGETINVYDIGIDLSHPTLGKIGEIGFLPQRKRKQLISTVRSCFEGLCSQMFLSNFYSYTLINSTSLDIIKEENRNCGDISEKEFRPHFVIDANQPFCEDHILDLKIGDNVHFSNIVPCTHRFEKHDHMNGSSEQNKLYDILKKTRTLQSLHPYLSDSSQLPVFGINLEIFQSGKISVNDEIYAKFRGTPEYYMNKSEK